MMKGKARLTNKQRTAIGIKIHDNGEIVHYNDKVNTSRKNDNVRPDQL